MKKIKILTFLLFSCIFTITAQVKSVYDQYGNAVAYVDFDDEILFSWDNTLIGYLEANAIIAKNGSVICWYENGIFYDKEGYAIGSLEDALDMKYNNEEPNIRSSRQYKPIKAYKVPQSPSFKLKWSQYSFSSVTSD